MVNRLNLEDISSSPKRSLFKAMGYDDEQLKRPLVGVVNSFNEIVSGTYTFEKHIPRCQRGRFNVRRHPNRIQHYSHL